MVEKAASVGVQTMSGAVLDPVALDALVPGWRESPPPMCVPVQRDDVHDLDGLDRLRALLFS